MRLENHGAPTHTGLERVHRALGRTWVRLAGGLSLLALVASIQPLTGSLGAWWQSRQPEADRRVIANLRVGVLFETFQDDVGVRPVARLDPVDGLEHYLFVLDNAYVQAFADKAERVAAFGVIMKDGEKSGDLHLPGLDPMLLS